MVQSKALRPEWLPAVALSAALAALMLIWGPPVGDLAAQVFHTELFEHAGLAIWNGSWYGGHYTLNYSVLFPPAGGAARAAGGGDAVGRRLLLPLRPPGPRPLGGRGALGDALVRGRGRHPARRRPADLRPRRRASGWRRCAACRWGGGRSRCSPPRPARWPARSPAPSSPASLLAGAWERGRAAQPRRARRRGAWRSSSPSPRTSPSPNRATSPSSSPPSSRSRSGARARSSSPGGAAARSASCAGSSSATRSPRP